MGTTEKVKLRILAFLLKAKEATAKQLEEKADCANKTFLKARQQLEKEGLIQKRYQNRKEGGLKAIYSIPQEKLQAVKVMLEREALKKNYNEKINSLNSPEDIEFYKKKLVNLEKELRYYKGLEILRQYEELPSLPAKAVLEKLKEMGFNGEGKLHNIGIGTGYNHFKPEDIELKIIPEKDSEDLPSMNFDDKFINLKLEYGPLWKVLNFKPVKGFFIIGTYKKPLQICEEIFEEFLLPEIRERFGLSHDEWEIVEPEIRRIFHEELSESEKYEMVRFRNIPKPIESFVREFKELYPISQKPDALEKIKDHYRRHYRRLLLPIAEISARKLVPPLSKSSEAIQDLGEFARIYYDEKYRERYLEELAREKIEYFQSLKRRHKS